jgi:hypothetical protein
VTTETDPVALLLGAFACGERLAAGRARENVGLAPDERARSQQAHIAEIEERRRDLVEARLAEVGSMDLATRFLPYFEAFYKRTEPADWIEGQTFHYTGDALVSEFMEEVGALVDPVTARVVKEASDRDAQEAFALDELMRAISADPTVRRRIAAYARTISGEALTQTSRALESAPLLREFLGGDEGEKRLLLELLERHRARLDRLGIDFVDDEDEDDDLI